MFYKHHSSLKFGPKNRAVKLHKARNTRKRGPLVNVHYNQCFEERVNHVCLNRPMGLQILSYTG